MGPLVVAVVGSTKEVPRLLTGLTGHLIRRGFRVELVQSDQQTLRGEKDIILISCQPQKVNRLADEITREWTEQWLQWYAKQKRNKIRSPVTST